jgi:hypothetical protein
MSPKHARSDIDTTDRIVAEARRRQAEREKTYRGRALKLFPWICGRCGREFSGKRLHELTVHHKDHNHNNNPPDGTNWELLCLYCHDNEHSRQQVTDACEKLSPDKKHEPSATHRPFAELEALLKHKK